MSGHDDQVEAPWRLVALHRGLNPLNLFRVRFSSSHSQHGRCRINTRHPVTTFGESTTERARTATQVENTTRTHSGKGDIEVGIPRPRINEVVNLRDLRVLIIHPLVVTPPRLPRADLRVVQQKVEARYAPRTPNHNVDNLARRQHE